MAAPLFISGWVKIKQGTTCNTVAIMGKKNLFTSEKSSIFASDYGWRKGHTGA